MRNIIILLVFVITTNCHAVGTITSVTGSVGDENIIVIGGSGFSETGPTIDLYDSIIVP